LGKLDVIYVDSSHKLHNGKYSQKKKKSWSCKIKHKMRNWYKEAFPLSWYRLVSVNSYFRTYALKTNETQIQKIALTNKFNLTFINYISSFTEWVSFVTAGCTTRKLRFILMPGRLWMSTFWNTCIFRSQTTLFASSLFNTIVPIDMFITHQK
jgi:hypothetical protein